MNKENNLLEQFENLDSIEPSAEWNEKFLQRLDSSLRKPNITSVNKLILLAIIILVFINVFSFSKSLIDDKEQKSSRNLKDIAAEFLINTNSSNY